MSVKAGLLPEKTGRKNWPEYAVSAPVVTLTGPNVAPIGTLTVIEFAVAEAGTARTAPKKIILLTAVGLKLAPLIVTRAPATPLMGLIDEIEGRRLSNAKPPAEVVP